MGWKEGSQIVIEARWADGQVDRLVPLAQELVAKEPAVIVAADMRAAHRARREASQVPLVMVSDLDPVAAGLVTNLARPGGMITGLAGFNIEIIGRNVEMLLAAAPKTKRIGFLTSSSGPILTALLAEARRATTQHAVEARFAEVVRPDEIEPALSRLTKEGAQALVMLPGAVVSAERRRIMQYALGQHWPVIGGTRAWADDGALLSYGADSAANRRRAASYVDRILRGAKPGDLPIEQPTKFELAVNMKTAKALGLTIPQSIMLQATRVIE